MKTLTITGNIAADAKLHQAQDNQFATFTVAINIGTKESQKIDWVDVICNNELVQVAIEQAKKGAFVKIEGFPTVSAYLDKDGNAKAQQKLFAKTFQKLEKK